MSTDLATEKPGPMGWGTDELDLDEKMYREAARQDRLAQLVPRRVMRGPTRQPVKKVLDKIKSEMALDGMEDGFNIVYMEQIAFKKWLPWLMQLIGSCVASGSGRCWTWRSLVDVFLLGNPESILGTSIVGVNNVAPFMPYHYRAGRRLGGLNGGRPSGRDDGSFCNEQAEAMMRYCVLPCSAVGLKSNAFPEPQSEALYREWGANDHLMDQFIDQAKPFQLLESEQVKDAETGKSRLIEDFKPQMICSSWAFKPFEKHPTWKLRNGEPVWIYVRDKSQRWDHNMSVVGFVYVAGNWYVVIFNSWGAKAHKNGHYFVIPIEVYAKWIIEAESRTIGDIDLRNTEPPFPEESIND